MTTSHSEATISADPDVPIVRIVRDFDAPAELLMRAHLDAELFCRWVGPDGMETETVDWDPTTGGRWRYVARRDGNEYWFRGCFHEIGERRIVQTFTWEGRPEGVALETLNFEDLGGGRTRLRSQALVDSFEDRDQWLASGMQTGIDQGYAKLDAVIAGLGA